MQSMIMGMLLHRLKWWMKYKNMGLLPVGWIAQYQLTIQMELLKRILMYNKIGLIIMC